MELVLGAVLGAVVAAAAVAALVAARRPPDVTTPALAELRAELARVADGVSATTGEIGRRLEARLEGIDTRVSQSQAAGQDLARGIFDTLGEVRSATVSVAEQAREFASLQNLLKPPKARGGLGEALLEELLRQVLPPQSFSIQHRFSSGTVVDAVVHLGGRLVCIDSKFPLANYQRMCDATDDAARRDAERAFAADVAGHIRSIADRYIVPDEDTFDFAVMYVPADGVYAEVLRLVHRQRPLFEMAVAARVVPMSPLTMYGYLQTVLYGLRCLSIEKSAERILDFCGRLQGDIERFASEYDTLGRHLGNARGKWEEGTRKLDRFRDKLAAVADLAEEDEDERRPALEVVGE